MLIAKRARAGGKGEGQIEGTRGRGSGDLIRGGRGHIFSHKRGEAEKKLTPLLEDEQLFTLKEVF